MPEKYWKQPRCRACQRPIRFVASEKTRKPFPLELHTSPYMRDPRFTTHAIFEHPTSGDDLVRKITDDEPFDEAHELWAVPHHAVCAAVPGRDGAPACEPRREEVGSRG